jgi:release factor glutamine methyltransferase
MRVAGNKVAHIAQFFHDELENIYGRNETGAMLKAALHHYLGFTTTDAARRMNEHINQSDLLKLYDCAKDLKRGIPLQYVLGSAEFHQLNFFVNRHVLIPRPETEELADTIIKENRHAASFLDIGTGSGCIAVSIKKNIPDADVHACDISDQALDVARKNAVQNHADIHFFKADALAGGEITGHLGDAVEVIVSNPPYIREDEAQSLSTYVIGHEPRGALFVPDNDAIIFYRKIIDLCGKSLNSGGRLYFELNPLTADEVKTFAERSGIFKSIILKKDMSGNTRFLEAVKK